MNSIACDVGVLVHIVKPLVIKLFRTEGNTSKYAKRLTAHSHAAVLLTIKHDCKFVTLKYCYSSFSVFKSISRFSFSVL